MSNAVNGEQTQSERKRENGSDTGSSQGRSSTETYVCAKAFDANTPEQLFRGTKHIVVGAEPLCGNHHVTKGIRSAESEYGMERAPYPLSHRVCERCAESYIATYGSNDALFAGIASFDDGQWVEITTTEGVVTGRVRSAVDVSSYPTRYLTVVIGSTPKERWLYRDVREAKIKVREGELVGRVDAEYESFVSEYGTEVVDVEATTPPANNIDQRTAATVSELESLFGDVALTVMAMGADNREFLVNVEYSVSEATLDEVVSDVECAGYDVVSRSECEREYNADGKIAIDGEEVVNTEVLRQLTVHASSLVDVE